MGVDDRERGVVADRADVAEMIGDALELGHDAAQDLGARRRIDLQRLLDRAGEGEAVGHGGIAGDARDHARRALDVGVGEQPVDALVHVAEPLLQPRHRLAVDAEAEMAGLDDAGVHRADRNLVQALALDRQEIVRPPDRAAPPAAARRAARACPRRRDRARAAGRACRAARSRRDRAPRARAGSPAHESGRSRESPRSCIRSDTTQGAAAPATRSARWTSSLSPHRPSRSPPPSPSACAIATQASSSTS